MKYQTYPARVTFHRDTGLLEVSNNDAPGLFFTGPQMKNVLLGVLMNLIQCDRVAFDLAVDRIRQYLR
jgi:hypothetical protein